MKLCGAGVAASVQGSATRLESPRTAPVTVHVSYETSLAMVTENFRTARLHLAECMGCERKASADLDAAVQKRLAATRYANGLRMLGDALAGFAGAGGEAWTKEMDAFLAAVAQHADLQLGSAEELADEIAEETRA
ncbi:hypothetical protein SAMN05421819_3540 [Bryocella elongata]|uniref:Uncharacterized protein n=2 Tax=Bryocella elongata TaxID=863522 RepID=A0A1H6B5B6_9BACT|nr:hypothetical protein SAMN05421819_3540 [Bryocella elongata]